FVRGCPDQRAIATLDPDARVDQRRAMTFAQQITRVPRPFERDRADETVAPFADLAPELRALLHGTAGCSPYLRGLITREAEWLRPLLQLAPDSGFSALMADVRALPDGDLASGLRQ